MLIQPIINIAEICSQKGIENVVLSPGSRCAHLSIAFVRHPQIKTYTVSDERSAAFIALGMAQQSKKPVALLCTSGTASLNYYPAIAEAFYQNIPLVVFTADRPDEWIDQLDGQTIRQQNVYANHIKKSYHLPVDYSHSDAVWHAERSVNEAINIAISGKKGPVHINVPIREPFYPEASEQMQFDKSVRIIKPVFPEKNISETYILEFRTLLQNATSVLLLVGQGDYDADFNTAVDQFAKKNNVPILADVISNIHSENKINHTDITLFDKSKHNSLKADLVLSFGKSVLSKNIKGFLKANKPLVHIHIQEGQEIADYSQSMSYVVDCDKNIFLKQISIFGGLQKPVSFLELWKNMEAGFLQNLANHFSESEFSEFEALKAILDHLPQNSILHLANSMTVRYANYLKIRPDVEVFANRGTSGIDGSTSTALGCSIKTDKIVTLITGDMAFLYDRNALWNNYVPANFRIVIMNNHAGGIFRIIDGPNRQPELNEYFETKQSHPIKNTCIDAGLDYVFIENKIDYTSLTSLFFAPSNKAKVLEVSTDAVVNTDVLKNFTKNYK